MNVNVIVWTIGVSVVLAGAIARDDDDVARTVRHTQFSSEHLRG